MSACAKISGQCRDVARDSSSMVVRVRAAAPSLDELPRSQVIASDPSLSERRRLPGTACRGGS